MGLLPEFDVRKTSKEKDKAALSKSSQKSSGTRVKTNTLIDKLEIIKIEVLRNLGKYKDTTIVIRDQETLHKYIEASVKNGILAIDTETTGLNPFVDNVVGLCLYTPNEKQAYIPINHVSYMDGNRLANQLTESQIAEELNYLGDTKIVMHNAKFDKRMLKNQCKADVSVYWDTMLGARCINELESAALKFQYATHIEGHSKEYDFDSLFKGVCFNLIPIDIAALYAATDPFITYELYEYQKEILDRPENSKVKSILLDIEMPLLEVVCAMEDYGIKIDTKYANELSVIYHSKLDDIMVKVNEELDKYSQQIKQYKITHPSVKLSDPISISSPVQLAILLYDILKLPQVSGRGTGEEVLKKLNIPLCDVILEYRGVSKLLTTYIDKLPGVAEKDGRIHASFNQVGADTGRLSSSDPNLQNIPSHDKLIRKMFVASPGYIMVGNDFSQQEPRHLANFSQDSKMINAYAHNLDFYATVAQSVYKVPYEQCLEFNPDGTVNKQGKERRSNCKSILLGQHILGSIKIA